MSTFGTIKEYLGQYYAELNYSCLQEKYSKTNIENLFEQRFYIQNNKVQMIVDADMHGLSVVVLGNEIHVSKELYDHPSITIHNSVENNSQLEIKSLYTPEIFSTMAYLICQNHTLFRISEDVDQPIYVRYSSDFESFYNSVVVFEIFNGINIELVEEHDSKGALNSVINYVLHSDAKLSLHTFYDNKISATSCIYRNIVAQEHSGYNHFLFGKGCANVIEENKISVYDYAQVNLYGVINSNDKKFHSILEIQPETTNYLVNVEYRGVITDDASVSVSLIADSLDKELSLINIQTLNISGISDNTLEENLESFTSDILELSVLDRMQGVKRFYDDKMKFLKIE